MGKSISFLVLFFCVVSNCPIATAQITGPSPIVWQPKNGVAIRDPELFKTTSGSYILTGTSIGVIEFPNNLPSTLAPQNGKTYRTSFYSPDGKRQLKGVEGFATWNNVFYQSPSGTLMLASLPPVKDFNTDLASNARRSTYVFIPKPGSTTTTPTGFPLVWQLRSNAPLVSGVYSVTPYRDPVTGKEYLESDVRQDVARDSTCMLGQVLGVGFTASPKNYQTLLCSGQPVSTVIDPMGFDRARPLSSEVRFVDGGGLVEGGWYYYSQQTKKYYLTYSSGAYDSADEYGGYVAVCDTPTGPCTKMMNQSNSEARRFVAGSSLNFKAVGRPYPVIDPVTGVLSDLIFHAHRLSDDTEVILRCTNFSATLIEQFVAGGRSCEYDVTPTSTEMMMRIVLDYASSSGAGTVHAKALEFADGTPIHNGEWFPLTQNGVLLTDKVQVYTSPTRTTFPGIVVSRTNGVVVVGQFGSSSVPSDYEITDGYIEVRNGTVSTSTTPSSFMELNKKQLGIVYSSFPTAYDYLQNTARDVVAFGFFVPGNTSDRFQLTVTPLHATIGATLIEDKATVIQSILLKLQTLIANFKL